MTNLTSFEPTFHSKFDRVPTGLVASLSKVSGSHVGEPDIKQNTFLTKVTGRSIYLFIFYFSFGSKQTNHCNDNTITIMIIIKMRNYR